jgi:hypothetical protein
MPKNTVSDPITDQEIAFACLIMSGTMNDRRAAEVVGLNPDTAAYTKSKPRVRAYMVDHRAPVSERLVDEEAEGLRKLNLGRDQILTRLWELATLSPEATRGSIAGQIKALAMIVAIEGLIPDRRFSPTETQPKAPPVEPQFYKSQWNREKQHQPVADEPRDPVAGTITPPAASQVPEPKPASNPATAAPPPLPDRNFDHNQPSLTDPLIPQGFHWVPQATDCRFDAVLDTTSSLRQPFSIKKGRFGRRR